MTHEYDGADVEKQGSRHDEDAGADMKKKGSRLLVATGRAAANEVREK